MLTRPQVSRKTSWLGIGHVSMTYHRHLAADFTVPTYLVEYGHFSNKPQVLDPFENVVAPFDSLVWATVAATVGLVGLAFLALHAGYARIPALAWRLNRPNSKVDFFLLPLGMLVYQDRVRWFRDLKRHSAGSILVLVWSLGGFVLALSYMSNLRASLIAVEYEAPIDTNAQILANDADLWYVKGTSLLQSLETSPLKIHRDLYDNVVRKETFYEYTGGMPTGPMDAIVARGRGSMISSRRAYRSQLPEFNARYGRNPFHFTRENLITLYAGIVVPKHVTWVEHVNEVISSLVEMGIMQHLFDKDLPLRYLYEQRSGGIKFSESPKKLALIQVLSPIMFLAGMEFLALGIFLVEVMMGRKGDPYL